MWQNMAQPGKPRMTTRHPRFACWITKAADIPSECVIIIAFPRQQWLRERAPVLRYTYVGLRFRADLRLFLALSHDKLQTYVLCVSTSIG
jgi:hypothetical protein